MKEITIKYDGEYPNLCRGDLIVYLEGVRWVFPEHCLRSGGGVWFDDEWGEHIEKGEWVIEKWPEGFPEDKKGIVLHTFNFEQPWGCCGGCV